MVPLPEGSIMSNIATMLELSTKKGNATPVAFAILRRSSREIKYSLGFTAIEEIQLFLV